MIFVSSWKGSLSPERVQGCKNLLLSTHPFAGSGSRVWFRGVLTGTAGCKKVRLRGQPVAAVQLADTAALRTRQHLTVANHQMLTVATWAQHVASPSTTLLNSGGVSSNKRIVTEIV